MVVKISDEIIVAIDSLASIFFLIATALSFRNYNKAKSKDYLWLIIGINFVFLFIMAISNVLEWSGITSALDPAEDFIAILVVFVWTYIFSTNV